MVNENLKFYLLTDLHHYAKSLGTSGKAYKKVYDGEHKCMAETGAIIDSAFDTVIADKDIDIVLIAGDVTFGGAKESHLDLLPRLKKLKDSGKQIYLITATHDYNDAPLKADGDEVSVATPTKREELYDLYSDYGRDRAISEHKESHSYSVILQKGYRLLCLNDDGDLKTFHGYSDTQIEWIKNQIAEAKENEEYIFVMTHHPALPPSPIYPLFSKKDMIGNNEEVTTMLADSGVKLIFTGHTHMQNVAIKTTEKGNDIYDINTGSLVCYPCPFRKIEISEDKIDIKTLVVENFDWDFGGKEPSQYVKDHFNYFIKDIIDSAAFDIDHLAELSYSFSMTPEKIYKNQKAIQFVGKKLQTLTLGKLGKYLFIKSSVDNSIKGILLKDLVLELVGNIYYGDEPYTPDTPIYKYFEAIENRIKPLLKFSDKKDSIISLVDLIKDGVLYDAPPSDWNVVLPR